MNPTYIADHCCRIERYQRTGSSNLALDSMYRIASNSDLFEPKDLGQILTPEQAVEIERFIADFKTKHPRLIEQYRKVRA